MDEPRVHESAPYAIDDLSGIDFFRLRIADQIRLMVPHVLLGLVMTNEQRAQRLGRVYSDILRSQEPQVD